MKLLFLGLDMKIYEKRIKKRKIYIIMGKRAY